MAFQRLSDNKVAGSDLGAFVENQLTNYKRQLSIRNADDETRFNRLVLESDLPLTAQLKYREEQLGRVADDPEEKRRVQGEISTLKDRMQQEEYSNAYLDKLISFESGHSSLESVVGFLQSQLATATDENVKKSIRQSLSTQQGALYAMKNSVLSAQTSYALQDKRAEILDAQITRVSDARAQAVLADNPEQTALYDIQLQNLQKAKSESQIEDAITNFSVGSMSGYQSATGLLDSYNQQIAQASPVGPVTIGGNRYDSAQQFWTFKRDSYIADDSASGLFPRMAYEENQALDVKRSSNALTNNDVAAAKSKFDMLSGRPELANSTAKLNAYRQDVIQHGVDLRAAEVSNKYTGDLDVNRAFNDLKQLKELGGNVSVVETDILSKAANLKETQVGNILGVAQDLLKANPGMTAEQAIAQAAATGAGVVLAPQQLVAKTETELAGDLNKGAQDASVQTDPRTTVGSEASKQAAAGTPGTAPAPTTPQQTDVSDKFGIVGKTVYDKASGQAFTTEKAFFDASGLTSFQNVKFDTAYQPPTPGVSPKLQEQPAPPATPTPPAPVAAAPAPAPAPTTYKVMAGDTLSGIAQKLLGDSGRYTEIAQTNKISDPNRISVGSELIIPKR